MQPIEDQVGFLSEVAQVKRNHTLLEVLNHKNRSNIKLYMKTSMKNKNR